MARAIRVGRLWRDRSPGQGKSTQRRRDAEAQRRRTEKPQITQMDADGRRFHHTIASIAERNARAQRRNGIAVESGRRIAGRAFDFVVEGWLL